MDDENARGARRRREARFSRPSRPPSIWGSARKMHSIRSAGVGPCFQVFVEFAPTLGQGEVPPLTAHKLEVQPTIKVRPGWPVRRIANKDLVLRPWKG
jgi:hypothetical protein